MPARTFSCNPLQQLGRSLHITVNLYSPILDTQLRKHIQLLNPQSAFNMVNQAVSSLDLDPTHTSCVGGKTVLTCRSCAGNAPRYVMLLLVLSMGLVLITSRNSVCSSCSGRGFNIYICTHCNPAAAINRRTSTTTPNGSTPASLSRGSSTSVSSYNDRLAPNSLRRFGDRDGGSGGGRLETNTNRPRGP